MQAITERIPTLLTPPAPVLAAAPAPADLAATIGDALSQGPTDAYAFEHALAALVRAVRTNREPLRNALLPILDRNLSPRLGRRDNQDSRDLPLATPLRQLHTLAVNAVWLPVSAHRYGYAGHSRDFELVRLIRRLSLTLDRPPGMDPYALRSPADILTLRLAELAAHIADPGPPEPVGTPTDPAGWLAPDTLVARIAEAESAGWQPWPLDFDQALLRLPENPDTATVRAAHRLVSPAGRRLAGWLRDGRPTLPSGVELMTDPKPPPGTEITENTENTEKQPRSPRIHPLTTLPDPIPTASSHAPSTLIHLLRRGWYPPRPLADGSCWTACWPALLPSRPDLIAIAVAWHPRHPDAHGDSCPTPVLTDLATTRAHTPHDVQNDTGTFAAIARALTSRSPAKRADAAHAFAALATSGHFDATRFAAALATFATRTDRQVLRSAVPTLQNLLKTNPPTNTPTSATPTTDTTPRTRTADHTATHVPAANAATHSPASDSTTTRTSPADDPATHGLAADATATRTPAANNTAARALVADDIAARTPAAEDPSTRSPAADDAAARGPAAAADRAIASALGTAILGWLPAILPPAVDQPLPYTSHLLNLAADALMSAHTPKRPTPKPSPTVSAAIDVLTGLANRPSRSSVSDAASHLLAVITQPF